MSEGKFELLHTYRLQFWQFEKVKNNFETAT